MGEMNITSAKYVLRFESSENIAVKATIDGIEMFIPLDPANRHYAEILLQVEAGTLTIQDAD